MRMLTTFIAGLLFGAGLLVSGMSDPGNVLGFLDAGGVRNPALAFVMYGAIFGWGLAGLYPGPALVLLGPGCRMGSSLLLRWRPDCGFLRGI